MVKVKICGITNLEDALAALFCGADAVGFVFYKKSPRYIDPLKAANISRILPKGFLRAGVFVDEDRSAVKKTARLCALDMLQFHGRESADYCRYFKGYKVVKAFPVAPGLDLKGLSAYRGCGFLFDTCSKGAFGGTGKKFNWHLLGNPDKIRGTVFISGGLTCANVSKAVKVLKPDWVDASSCLESSPGKKDHKKIERFIRAARRLRA